MDLMHPNSSHTCDKSRTILIVEDSPIYRELLQNYLSQDDRYNYTILETETGVEGLRQYQIAQPDAILLDYLLPDMNGLEFLQALQQQIDKPDLPVVLLTGCEYEQLATRAIELGAQQYLNKSQLTTENLRLSLHHAIKQGDLLRQVAALQAQNDRHLAVLARQEEQLRLALASARMGMWDWNLRSGEIEWNQEQEQLFGLLPGSFDGTAGTFTGYIHPDDRPLVMRFAENTIAERAILCHQFRIVWADGSIHWIETRGEVHFDEAGQPHRMIGTAIDIDDRHQAQQLLQNQLEQQRLVMDMTGRIRRSLDLSEILQTTVDEVRQFLQTDRVIVYEFAPNWSGMAICESVGADWKAVRDTYIYNTDCIKSDLGHYQQGLITVRSDIYAVHIDAWQLQLLESFQVRANIVVPIFKGDELWGLLSCHHCAAPRPWQTAEIELLEQIASQVSIAIQQADLLTQAQSELTHRNHAEMTLQLLNAELAQRQAVERLKDEFIGIVSHELRTPLTSMQGALGLLAMGVMDDEPAQMKQMIKIAAIETERLVRMVNDILDLEKLAADSHGLALGWCDARTLIQQAIASMSSSADAAHVQLQLDCPPLQIWAAPDRIVQVFTNLLSNAIKFSHPGGVVSIAVSTATASPEPICSGTRSDLARSAVTSRGQQIHFTVSDRGRGIPPAKLETIFDRFQQVDSSDARDKGGTGLGLAICKSIVLQHQGQIWVESTWGQGSTFFVTLPQPMNENRSNSGTL